MFTPEQRVELKQMFLDAWNDTSISSKNLAEVLTTRAHQKGLLPPNVPFTDEAVKASYTTMGEEYSSYRKRKRKAEPKDLIINFAEVSFTENINTTNTNY